MAACIGAEAFIVCGVWACVGSSNRLSSTWTTAFNCSDDTAVAAAWDGAWVPPDAGAAAAEVQPVRITNPSEPYRSSTCAIAAAPASTSTLAAAAIAHCGTNPNHRRAGGGVAAPRTMLKSNSGSGGAQASDATGGDAGPPPRADTRHTR